MNPIKKNTIKKVLALVKVILHSLARAGKAGKQVANRPAVAGRAGGLALTAPWVLYVNKLAELFRSDPEVHVFYSNDICSCDVSVASDDKYWALKALLPNEKKWGKVILKIRVLPANDVVQTGKTPTDPRQLVRLAFSRNPSISAIVDVDGGTASVDFTFVVFRPEVVQYYSDDLGDVNGLTSTLRADLCKELLHERTPGVFYCTDRLLDRQLASSLYRHDPRSAVASALYSRYPEEGAAPAEDQAVDGEPEEDKQQ